MTVDQIVELKRGEAPQEREKLTGSINFENYRVDSAETVAKTLEEDTSEKSADVSPVLDLPRETAPQDTKENEIIDFPSPKAPETPFDLVEERRRRAA